MDSDGCEIYLRPVRSYLTGKTATMEQIVVAVAVHGQIAFGLAYTGTDGNVVVKVNPEKSESVELGDDLRVVVLSED